MSADGAVEVEDALADMRAVGGDGVWVVEVGGVTEKGGFTSQRRQREGAFAWHHRRASAETASLTS
jgi:hypothetical protein